MKPWKRRLFHGSSATETLSSRAGWCANSHAHGMQDENGWSGENCGREDLLTKKCRVTDEENEVNEYPVNGHCPRGGPRGGCLLHHNGNDMSCVPTGSIVIKYLPSHEIMQWFTIDISCHRTTCIYLHLDFVDTVCNVTSCVMIDYSIFGNGCVGIIFESLAIPSIVLRGKRWCVRDQQLENAMIDSS